ncbi:MAG: sodium:proton exchanger [Candidatus Doudnabacteria bacterium RIFCSPHIGHO2_12_FULL_48_11]|uniref:Sodium:proton exchanger n=1 Tax=Candidatus Doudnabacteria bacterium RIFCSPHIGHO2_01_FULL_46_24 TaxID=1817825 RepID=A0A1F5NTA9_9BACT|nr:MAG: sodium:proton exchanger [Candidatus Doudnabacteria bacterium RIFCSPHIGHO2_01_FULL_46_24]OGE96157.1 MAG: sodium:proton exchanger [Candidatus Doudnabacteria bacterium RIFCSPHIGHO2_12_FULL_48_11]
MLTYALFLLGFAVLIKGADLLVDGASSIARRLRVSDLVIGLTIVAFGTSAPELFVNIFASMQGNTDIAVGNIIGSNIVNMLFILGLAAVIYPLKVTKGTVWKEIPLSLLAVALVFFMANDRLVDRMDFDLLTRSDGLSLLAFFIIFLYYTFGIAKAQGEEFLAHPKQYSLFRSIGMIALGLFGLVVGGQWIVNGAISIAQSFGLSEALIGLTIVAVGTSLPELATSLVAAYKKSPDIAVGNVVGSNIFNVFLILGLSSVIRPLPLNSDLNFDIMIAAAAAVLLFGWMFIGKHHRLERWEGGVFVAFYIFYLTVIIMRG